MKQIQRNNKYYLYEDNGQLLLITRSKKVLRWVEDNADRVHSSIRGEVQEAPKKDRKGIRKTKKRKK